MIELLVLTLFPGLMIASAVSDIAKLRIPNVLVLSLVGFFAICALVVQMPLERLGDHALAGGIMLVAGFALFAPGYIGGGDAKLMAAAALWLGLDGLLPFIFFMTMFGGALALTLLMFRKLPLPAPLNAVDWIGRLHTPNGAAPYGVAISAGALIAFNNSIWISLIS